MKRIKKSKRNQSKKSLIQLAGMMGDWTLPSLKKEKAANHSAGRKRCNEDPDSWNKPSLQAIIQEPEVSAEANRVRGGGKRIAS